MQTRMERWSGLSESGRASKLASHASLRRLFGVTAAASVSPQLHVAPLVLSPMSTTEQRIELQQPAVARPEHELVVSVVIPCLNEAENIHACVTSALDVLEREQIRGEVIVADNGS